MTPHDANRFAGRPLDRLEFVGAAGLPVGTIKGGGLRIDVATRLAAAGLAIFVVLPIRDRVKGKPWRWAYPAQMTLALDPADSKKPAEAG